MTDGRRLDAESVRPVVARHFDRQVADLTIMRWGFDADTWCAAFVDGDKVVVQHRPPETADRIVVATDFLDRSGMAVPEIIGHVSDGTGTYLMFRWVEGEPGARALTAGSGSELATAMGRSTHRLRRLDPTGLRSDPAWVGPEELRAAAATWRCALPAIPEIPARIDLSMAAVAGSAWTAAPCHGDFAPVNAIVGVEGRLTLLDLADLANRHPLIDPAWWGLVVRHHHPDAFQVVFSEFVAAAECDLAVLADVAVVRAWQSAAAIEGAGRDHRIALLRSAVAWADEVHGRRPG